MRDTILFILIIFAFIGVVLDVGYIVGHVECEEKAQKMQLEYDFGLFSECMIKVDNKLIPINSYRIVNGN